MTVLGLAIQQGDWAFVAVCLLLGITETASRMPAGTLDAILHLLEEPARHART